MYSLVSKLFEKTFLRLSSKLNHNPRNHKCYFLKTRPNKLLENCSIFATGKNNFIKNFLAEEHLPRKRQCD